MAGAAAFLTADGAAATFLPLGACGRGQGVQRRRVSKVAGVQGSGGWFNSAGWGGRRVRATAAAGWAASGLAISALDSAAWLGAALLPPGRCAAASSPAQ